MAAFLTKRFYFILVIGILAACSRSIPRPDLTDRYPVKVKLHRAEKDSSFRDPETSPLPDTLIGHFEGLHYFPVDTNFVVNARFRRTPGAKSFIMETTGPKQPEYIKYGVLYFDLKGKRRVLNVYRNLGHINTEFNDYLFVPFTDETNGDSTYGGGRYLDLYLPIKDNEIVRLDFNLAYNPYCVYNYGKFDCPVPPSDNRLDISVKAGEKMYRGNAGAIPDSAMGQTENN